MMQLNQPQFGVVACEIKLRREVHGFSAEHEWLVICTPAIVCLASYFTKTRFVNEIFSLIISQFDITVVMLVSLFAKCMQGYERCDKFEY